MPLTPDDVSSKRFTPVRLREGYEMGEVDQFLDEVEAELHRLNRENDDLRKQLKAAGAGDDGTTDRDTSSDDEKKAEQKAAAEKAEAEKAEAEKAEAEKAQKSASDSADHKSAEKTETTPAQGEARVLEEIKVTTSSEASKAASRLLELATNNAEILVDEAREEADTILEEAKTEAEEITGNAEKRKESLDGETEKRREELTAGLEKERKQLDQKVTNLRQFEKSYRESLKGYFAEQLEQIENVQIEPEEGPADAGTSSDASGSKKETPESGATEGEADSSSQS